MAVAGSVSANSKMMVDIYHLQCELTDPLSAYAHAMRETIEDTRIKEVASLEW